MTRLFWRLMQCALVIVLAIIGALPLLVALYAALVGNYWPAYALAALAAYICLKALWLRFTLPDRRRGLHTSRDLR